MKPKYPKYTNNLLVSGGDDAILIEFRVGYLIRNGAEEEIDILGRYAMTYQQLF